MPEDEPSRRIADFELRREIGRAAVSIDLGAGQESGSGSAGADGPKEEKP